MISTAEITFEHRSVLPHETLVGLNLHPGQPVQSNGIYVDGTLGGGGHSSLILQQLGKNARLIGIDQDENAILAAASRLKHDPRFKAVRGNFHHLPQILHAEGITHVDGVLLDLGVSSHQLDTAERGFSYRLDGPLDMRMDNRAPLSAADIVNEYAEKDLADLLFTYGEERQSRKLAKAICKTREISPITTTLQLAEIIERTTPRPKFKKGKPSAPHPAMRSFMALRIAVNDELSPLGSVIGNIVDCLKTEGRIAIITFHSLEDRIVKNTFQTLNNPCVCPRDIPYCVCKNEPKLKIITRKPIIPSETELEQNSRSHSAKLRIAQRIG